MSYYRRQQRGPAGKQAISAERMDSRRARAVRRRRELVSRRLPQDPAGARHEPTTEAPKRDEPALKPVNHMAKRKPSPAPVSSRAPLRPSQRAAVAEAEEPTTSGGPNALLAYKGKRNFEKAAEPRGQVQQATGDRSACRSMMRRGSIMT